MIISWKISLLFQPCRNHRSRGAAGQRRHTGVDQLPRWLLPASCVSCVRNDKTILHMWANDKRGSALWGGFGRGLHSGAARRGNEAASKPTALPNIIPSTSTIREASAAVHFRVALPHIRARVWARGNGAKRNVHKTAFQTPHHILKRVSHLWSRRLRLCSPYDWRAYVIIYAYNLYVVYYYYSYILWELKYVIFI